ncbi:bacteriohemerythrin [Clostridium fermenticellae]|uniref:Bacteriohemerythrin n=1 Tax=Clostridium fermenticellae TaxID=2068654 RepID=A0A386H5T1_9CLOT|nr:hemerythrin family protein [Clostridium fermenticellae]AYD40903.1 bacteriohemerythrin [Clostridium fermenticellae]
MFEWKREYETGIEIIDSQHKELFKIANRSYKLLKNDMVTDKYDRVVEIINELLDYCEYHFSTEEKFLIDIKYNKFISHKSQHEEFIKKLRSSNLNDIDDNQDEYLMDILNFFIKWISGHILSKDMDYVRFNNSIK